MLQINDKNILENRIFSEVPFFHIIFLTLTLFTFFFYLLSFYFLV